MEYYTNNSTVEQPILLPSKSFDDEIKEEEEQIFKDVINESEDIAHKNFIADNSRDIDYGESDDEELINEMINYELNEQNDDVEKIVLNNVIIILNPEDVVIKKKRNYTEAHRKAQQKYREKYPEKYRELQRKVYNNLKQNDEWRKVYNEKSKEIQKKYRNKKREELINNGVEIKPRGRPRKINIDVIDDKVDDKKEVEKIPDGEIELIV